MPSSLGGTCCSFTSGKPSQALPEPTLWHLGTCSVTDKGGETEAERALVSNLQRMASAQQASLILFTIELNANKHEWYLGRCRIGRSLSSVWAGDKKPGDGTGKVTYLTGGCS